MTQTEHSTASAGFPAIPQISRAAINDAVATINRADCLVELINMAAESAQITGDSGNAIAWCCVHIRDLLDKAGDILVTAQKQEGGEA